jgi:hypothetical protein
MSEARDRIGRTPTADRASAVELRANKDDQ